MTEIRYSALGIPMIPETLRQQLFPDTSASENKIALRKSIQLLKEFDLYPAPTIDVEAIPEFQLPKLQGSNLGEHFDNIGREMAEPWWSIANQLADAKLPPRPTSWLRQVGWTRYVPGESPESVPYPLEAGIVFDVETAVMYGGYPVMAAAVSSEAWYFWVSPELFRGAKTLVPLGVDYKLVVAHHCVPLNTEALTPQGWVLITKLKPGDLVMGYDEKMGKNRWVKVKNYVDGGVQEVFKTRVGNREGKEWLSTLGHRWVTKKTWRKDSYRVNYLTTQDLMKQTDNSQELIIHSAPYFNNTPADISEVEAGLMGWIIGDGTIFNGGKRKYEINCTITQSVSNYNHCAVIEYLISKLGYPVKKNKVKGKGDCVRYRIPSDFIRTIFYKLKVTPQEYSPEKLVLSLSNSCLEALVSHFWLAEGGKCQGLHKVFHQYYQVNKDKFEAIQLAIYLLGDTTTPNSDLTQFTRVDKHSTARRLIHESLGLMPVGCIETETSNWVMRQGHFMTLTGNCPFDRSRVHEEYQLQTSKVRYFDTLSAHVIVAGLSSKQKLMFKKIQKQRSEGFDSLFNPLWADVTTMNSLKDLAEFYLGKKVDKQIRDLFVSGTLDEIRDNFTELANYNADDVETTHQVYRILFKKFKRHCPNIVTFAGMLEMSIPYIPVTNQSWEGYKARAQSAYNKAVNKIESSLNELALETIENYSGEHGLDPQTDPWLKHLNWELPGKRAKLMRDKPEWYRDATKNGKKSISSRVRVTPYLLKMTWMGYPLYFCEPIKDSTAELLRGGLKWGYLVPKSDEYTTNQTGYDLPGFPNYTFYKLPHKDGEASNTGNPLAKDYLTEMESGILSSENPVAKEVLELAISISYWTGTQKRVMEQFVIYDKSGKGVILPQMIISGTVTRRAVEPLWLTASNAKKQRIGKLLALPM